jgi:hypothetical protein
VSTWVREAEWKEKEAHNDAEATQWAVEAPDGWGNTCLSSPVHENWPGDMELGLYQPMWCLCAQMVGQTSRVLFKMAFRCPWR